MSDFETHPRGTVERLEHEWKQWVEIGTSLTAKVERLEADNASYIAQSHVAQGDIKRLEAALQRIASAPACDGICEIRSWAMEALSPTQEMDSLGIERAMQIVYSMAKDATREHIEKATNEYLDAERIVHNWLVVRLEIPSPAQEINDE